jgi:hypothetical protein
MFLEIKKKQSKTAKEQKSEKKKKNMQLGASLGRSRAGSRPVKPKVREAIDMIKRGESDLGLLLTSETLSSEDWRVLADEIKGNTTLKQLNLARNPIVFAGAQALSEALASNASLTTLGLERSDLGPAGARAVAEALRTNTSLTELSMEFNEIGVGGAQAIGEALRVNSSISTLWLNGNKIADAGAQAIAAALWSNVTLTGLSLSSNHIHAAGVTALAEAVKANRTLTWLSLWGNAFKDAGAEALAEALKVNTTLRDLNLHRCSLTAAGARSILAAAESLHVLNLSENGISEPASLPIESEEAVLFRVPESLVELNVSKNGLQVIPVSFALNTTLKRFEADDNPWRTPPPEIVKRGVDAILAFLREMFEQGSSVCMTAKILILGLFGAGKTSLLNAITNHASHTSPVIAKGDRTIGIERKIWKPDAAALAGAKPALEGLEILAYDFGGQREYYVTHQLFLTDRAVYILVFDLKSFEMDKVGVVADQWLDSVQAKTPGAQVVLVATHADACSKSEAARGCEKFAAHVVSRLAQMQRMGTEVSADRRDGRGVDDRERPPGPRVGAEARARAPPVRPARCGAHGAL